MFSTRRIIPFYRKKIDQTFHQKSHFSELRISAEKIARKNSQKEEITFDDIYQYLQSEFSDEILSQIKKWELEYEFSFCQFNPAIKSIYDYCLLNNKKILVVTDIYLPESLIKNILDKVGVRYNLLFVSSSYNATKYRGSLFKMILSKLSISASEIIHIGDNKKSDYLIPRKLGINAVFIQKDTACNLFLAKKKYNQSLSYKNLCSFISNHVPHYITNLYEKTPDDYFFHVGYEVEGPLIYGFTKWLQKELCEKKIDKVFFLARDGQIIQKAYKKLKEHIPNFYMYASRKAFIVPTIWIRPNLSDLECTIFWPKSGTIPSFLKKIGLNPTDFKKIFSEANFDYHKKYVYKELWHDETFIKIYDSYIKQVAIKHSKKAYDLLVTYLKQLRFEGRIAIVDIGWFGHMQFALQKVIQESGLNVDLYGYYIGLRPTSPLLGKIKAKGYLFDRNLNPNNSVKEATFNALIELLFTANHGTTLGFKLSGEMIVPVLEEWEYQKDCLENEYRYIQVIQNGALAFVDDMLKEDKYFNIEIDGSLAFINWMKLGCSPSKISANYFGDLHMLDDDLDYLALPKTPLYYLFNPARLKYDILVSRWRVGFMTRLFGDMIPYYKIYAWLKLLSNFIKNKHLFNCLLIVLAAVCRL